MRNILRNFTMSVAGVVTPRHMEIEINGLVLPLPGDISEDHHGGGMPGPVALPLGVQLSDAGFTVAGWNRDLIGRLGMAAGFADQISFRGTTKSETDGATQAILASITGRVSEADPDEWEKGNKSLIAFTVASIRYYKLKMGDRVVHEIDFINGIQIVNGVDQMADLRTW